MCDKIFSASWNFSTNLSDKPHDNLLMQQLFVNTVSVGLGEQQRNWYLLLILVLQLFNIISLTLSWANKVGTAKAEDLRGKPPFHLQADLGFLIYSPSANTHRLKHTQWHWLTTKKLEGRVFSHSATTATKTLSYAMLCSLHGLMEIGITSD